jgi:hypothetical protein
MKKAFLLSPLIAAVVFAGPEAWQQIREPGPGYVPVLNELLLVLFGYLAAAVANAAMIVPLCMLVRLKSPGPIAGLVLAIFLALFVTTVAYAFEVFDYQTSILHPAYLYTLLIPLFLLTLLSFYFLDSSDPKPVVEKAAQESQKEEGN